MSRFFPALLVSLVACTGPGWADDAAKNSAPPLESRVGRTVTVVEANKPHEKAIITQVWRLDDGSPVMLAKSLTSGLKMTMVENLQAKTAAERVKVYRWNAKEVAPVGCPVAPVIVQTSHKAQQAVKQTSVPAATKQTVVQASVVSATKQTVVPAAASDKVVTTDGGLLPVLPKREEAKATLVKPPEVMQAPKQVVVQSVPVLPVTPPAKKEVVTPPVTVAKSMPVVTSQTMVAPVLTSVTPPPAQTTPAPAPKAIAPSSAPAAQVQAAPVKRELADGCEVITVNENGKDRKFKVLGSTRDRDGATMQRCQALDNGEIITLSCGKVCAPKAVCAAPAAPCPPVAVACPPVKCEPTKVACPPVAVAPVKKCEPAPCKPVCEPVKKCEPIKVCEPAKKCEPAPCVTKPAEPCKEVCKEAAKADCKEVCVKEKHHKCRGCNDSACDDCAKRARKRERVIRAHETLASMSCKFDKWQGNFCEINVPVPGVCLATVNGMPSGAPPQPMIPAFCTANSSSIRAALCAPQCGPICIRQQPFSPCLNAQIQDGICQAHGEVEGAAIKNTLYLVNVLNNSREWENRAWAAQRLEAANLPQVKPYVVDVLMASIVNERAPQVRVAAIRTVAQLNPQRPDVQAMLAQASVDADPRIREVAMDCLGKNQSVQQAGFNK